MAELSGEGGGVPDMSGTPEFYAGENGGNVRPRVGETGTAIMTTLTISGSFKEGKSSSRRRAMVRPSMDADEFMNLLRGSDPVKVELNRLENEVRDKDRELSEAQAEIKALKLSEHLREKAVEELTEELTKVDEKLKLTESLLESKESPIMIRGRGGDFTKVTSQADPLDAM